VSALRNVRTNSVVASNVARAEKERDRMVGFLQRDTLDGNEGLWFANCKLVHTFGMRTAIDLIFVDGEARIVRMVSGAPAWRIYAERRAQAVIELSVGTAKRASLSLGDCLVLEN